MRIKYKDAYMERLCTDHKFAVKELNLTRAKGLGYCFQALKTYDSVDTLIRLKVRNTHQLTEYKGGEHYAMNISANYRLIFSRDKDEDTLHVVRIEEIVDYH